MSTYYLVRDTTNDNTARVYKPLFIEATCYQEAEHEFRKIGVKSGIIRRLDGATAGESWIIRKDFVEQPRMVHEPPPEVVSPAVLADRAAAQFKSIIREAINQISAACKPLVDTLNELDNR